MAVIQGTTVVPTAAAKIYTQGPTGSLVINSSTVACVIGGPSLGSGAAAGIPLPASMTAPVFVPGNNSIPGPAESPPITDDVWASAAVTVSSLTWLTNY
jgi:hypothetical protein